MKHARKSKPSLRNRAILYASLFGIVVIGLTLFGYRGFIDAQNTLEQNRHERQLLFDDIHLLQGHLLETYRQLDNLLLDPDQLEYIDKIHLSLNNSFSVISDMQQRNSWGNPLVSSNIQNASEELQILKTEIDHLIEIRRDVTRVYPSLEIASGTMRINRVEMNDYMSIAFTASVDAKQLNSMEEGLVPVLINVRHLWTVMVSEFRVYMANRLGSFNKEAISKQEASIKLLMEELTKEINLLKKLDKEREFDLEINDAINKMSTAILGWYRGFERVRKIDEWRIDSKIMKEKISPRIKAIVTILDQLESVSKIGAENDLKSIGDAAHSPVIRLVYVTIIGMTFIVLLIVSLDRQIFKPITMVVNAIRARALGRDEALAPMANSFETFQLIDAFSEMNRRVQERQTELEYKALHDSLTTLPNRALLLNKFEYEITVARRESKAVSFLMIDLNDFKQVNDEWGHHVGDGLLIESALRMKGLLREVDIISRLGGDEFCIVLPNTDMSQSELVAKKIIDVIAEPFEIDGIKLNISCSIGISIFPEHDEDYKRLMQDADVAMYTAKNSNSGYAIYNPDDKTVVTDVNTLKNDICTALKEGQMTLVYQPKLSFVNNRIHCVEVLLRWDHPSYGAISPDQIINVAERVGLIDELTNWIIDTAVFEVKSWGQDWSDFSISINLSGQSLSDENFIDMIKKILSDHAMPVSMLSLGLAANMVVTRPVQAIEFMDKLDNIGIKLTINNYGVSTISSALIRKLPISAICIDRSLISGIEKDKGDALRVRSIIEQLHNIDIPVAAAGVDTITTGDLLKAYGCDYVQGDIFVQPKDNIEISKMLSNEIN